MSPGAVSPGAVTAGAVSPGAATATALGAQREGMQREGTQREGMQRAAARGAAQRRAPGAGAWGAEQRGMREGGSASVMALGVGLALFLVAVGFQAAGAAAVARHRAGVAADLAALAGALHVAEGPAAACDRARALTVENGAVLITCAVTGTDVTVTVAVAPAGPAALVGRASASARAGPVTG